MSAEEFRQLFGRGRPGRFFAAGAFPDQAQQGRVIGHDIIEPIGFASHLQNFPATVSVDNDGLHIADGSLFIDDAYGSSVLGASGFAGTWADFIALGLYNGTFAAGVTGAITYASTTDLPYWVASNGTGTGTTLTRTADATWPSGYRLRGTWVNANSKGQIRSDPVAIVGGTVYRCSAMWGWNIVGAADLAALQVNIEWYDTDLTLLSADVLGLDVRETGSATLQTFESSSPATAPANARYAKVIVAWRDVSPAAPDSGNYIDIGRIGIFATHPREGDAFPTIGADDGDRFYRTDLRMEFFYDDALNRWMSTEVFSVPLSAMNATEPYTATTAGAKGAATPALLGASDIYLLTHRLSFFVASGGSALSASHKWTGSLTKLEDETNSATAIHGPVIDSGSSGVWRTTEATINAVLGSGTVYDEFQMGWTMTGTPGTLRASSTLYYRIIAT